MLIRPLILSFLLISTVSLAAGRAPAVEDFVGIDIEESQVVPVGTESLFNLEQDVHQIREQKSKSPEAKQLVNDRAEVPGLDLSALFGIALGLGLPLAVWLLTMAHLRKKASLENASNIEVLERYRQEREKKARENVRKAS